MSPTGRAYRPAAQTPVTALRLSAGGAPGAHGGGAPEGDRLLAAPNAQLAVDGAGVGLHGVERDVELARDLPLGERSREEAQDRPLALAELGAALLLGLGRLERVEPEQEAAGVGAPLQDAVGLVDRRAPPLAVAGGLARLRDEEQRVAQAHAGRDAPAELQ